MWRIWLSEQSKRPHYHLLIFGWKPDDNDAYSVSSKGIPKENRFGQKYYLSHLIDETWIEVKMKDGKEVNESLGLHCIGDFTWETAAYVARYTTKKVGKLDKDFYEKNNIAPEFIVMSRKPGIGREWFNSHKDCYATFLENYVSTEFGSRPIGHNKYFDSLLDEDTLSSIKQVRSDWASRRKKIELISQHTNYPTLLQKKDELSEKKAKLLPRKDI